MSIELRPLGVACNLACHYCYQNPQRDAGNQQMKYDLAKMKAEAKRIGGRFTLFGGEPLLMRFEDLEDLLAWGFETCGGSSIQTNGVLVESRHIDLFRKYNVSVGVSLDGPGELNDARWVHNLEKTRAATASVEAAIERLCREYQPPGLIVTLHKGNARADKLPIMADWFCRLHAIGVKNIRLHLLEVDHSSVRDGLALSPRDNVEALLAFAEVQQSLPGMHFDLFDEIEALLEGRDKDVGCTWRACDPYTTEAVQGVEGNGQSSNCGRTNKDGIGFIKSNETGYERYLALYHTPQSDNGCQGCRFFLMCKGQCPGTSVDGDWRNRTEHCEEWKRLFGMIERRMILAGKVPLTIQPLRLDLENAQVQAWQQGDNPSIGRLLEKWLADRSGPKAPNWEPRPTRPRMSWVSESARSVWQPRLEQIAVMLEDLIVHTAAQNTNRLALRIVPHASVPRLERLAAEQGLASLLLPTEALPGGISTRPADPESALFLAGSAGLLAAAKDAWEDSDLKRFYFLAALPACCANRLGAAYARSMEVPAEISSHALLSMLGLSVLPIEPCRFDCQAALHWAERSLKLASAVGYTAEAAWLRECLAWPLALQERHGVLELKAPVFRACSYTGAPGTRLIRRLGDGKSVEGGAHGLSFPYQVPSRYPQRLVQIMVA